MKLLLALDGSESALAAVDFLLCFPFPEGSEVVLLSVIDDSLFREHKDGQLPGEARQAVEDTHADFHNEGAELLSVQAERLTAAGWRCSTEVHSGHPAKEIVASAHRLGTDLIVMGSHGLSGVKRFLLGSVSARVMEYAHCSALIVRKPQNDRRSGVGCQRLLLAYDGSESAKTASSFCHSLPLKPGSEIDLLTVMPLVTIYRQDIRQRLNNIWQDKKAAIHTSLDTLVATAPWPEVKVNAEIREGPSISKEILDAAIEHNSDLVILGDKGKGTFERMLLGSATSRVAHHAHCSVLAVRG